MTSFFWNVFTIVLEKVITDAGIIIKDTKFQRQLTLIYKYFSKMEISNIERSKKEVVVPFVSLEAKIWRIGSTVEEEKK